MTDELYAEQDDGTFAPPDYIPGPGFVPAAPSRVTTTRLESADLVHRICVHELAEAIAVVNGSDVLTKAVPDGYLRIAHDVLDYIDATPSCSQKGAR